MARMSRVRRAHLKQKRAGVAEIRLREMNREAHRRASGTKSVEFYRTLEDLVSSSPDDICSEMNRYRRELLGLEDQDQRTPREEILQKLHRVFESAVCLFRLGTRAMFLIQSERGWFFLYRDKGKYYKKSCVYASRARAMEWYEKDRITWLTFVDDI